MKVSATRVSHGVHGAVARALGALLLELADGG